MMSWSRTVGIRVKAGDDSTSDGSVFNVSRYLYRPTNCCFSGWEETRSTKQEFLYEIEAQTWGKSRVGEMCSRLT